MWNEVEGSPMRAQAERGVKLGESRILTHSEHCTGRDCQGEPGRGEQAPGEAEGFLIPPRGKEHLWDW